MKKYSVLIIAVLLAFTLSGCKSQSGGNSSVNKKAVDKYEKTYGEERAHQKKVMDEASFNQNEEQNEAEYRQHSKEADEEFSQAIEGQEKNSQQATKDYLAMLKEAESLAEKGKFTEAKEKIRYADLPGSDEKGQAAKAKGTDYEEQLQQLEWLQKYEEQGVSGLDASVRKDSRKAIDLENGSKVLAKLIKEMTEQLDSGQKMEKTASNTTTEGYKANALPELTITEGVDSTGTAQATSGEIKLKGVYNGGTKHLAINDNGTIMGNVEVASDGSFEIHINNIDKLPWGFDVIPSDTLKAGQTDVISYDQGEGKYCHIKVK
ncbi:hypothetical protein [Enterococcus gilvus]|uniref:hypothetical protein n=1 Tax=Enterococcus gilvus TaxID=160453 RepID=UPI00290D2363|nr:hypothetical protein [Enterococcus gilvus]MDU5509806.1 hypothetical protein [Enterococcus gilvus]